MFLVKPCNVYLSKSFRAAWKIHGSMNSGSDPSIQPFLDIFERPEVLLRKSMAIDRNSLVNKPHGRHPMTHFQSFCDRFADVRQSVAGEHKRLCVLLCYIPAVYVSLLDSNGSFGFGRLPCGRLIRFHQLVLEIPLWHVQMNSIIWCL